MVVQGNQACVFGARGCRLMRTIGQRVFPINCTHNWSLGYQCHCQDGAGEKSGNPAADRHLLPPAVCWLSLNADATYAGRVIRLQPPAAAPGSRWKLTMDGLQSLSLGPFVTSEWLRDRDYLAGTSIRMAVGGRRPSCCCPARVLRRSQNDGARLPQSPSTCAGRASMRR